MNPLKFGSLLQNKKRSSRHSRHLSPPKITTQQQAQSSSSSSRWECHACTYLNKARLDICDMCGKSRNSPLPPPPQQQQPATTATTANGISAAAASNGFDDVLDGGGGGGGGDVIACQKCTLENDRKLKVGGCLLRLGMLLLSIVVASFLG